MRVIKFRRYFFLDENKKQLNHAQEWGVNIGHSEFTTPSTDNFTKSFVDCQFTGLLDKNGSEIYEEDKLKVMGGLEYYVVFNNFSWCVTNGKQFYGFDQLKSEQAEIIGSIHATP